MTNTELAIGILVSHGMDEEAEKLRETTKECQCSDCVYDPME